MAAAKISISTPNVIASGPQIAKRSVQHLLQAIIMNNGRMTLNKNADIDFQSHFSEDPMVPKGSKDESERAGENQ